MNATAKQRSAFRAGALTAIAVTLLGMSSCAAKVSGDLLALCQKTLEVEASHPGSLAGELPQPALDFIYEYLFVVDLACGRVDP